MAQKGLTKQIIVQAAAERIERGAEGRHGGLCHTREGRVRLTRADGHARQAGVGAALGGAA